MRRGKLNPNWKGGKFVKCKNCGKEIWKTPSQLKKWKNFYCSKECRIEYYKKKKPKCKYCGKIITKRANKKFCDFKCYKNYKLNNVYELNCKYCGKKIKIIKWRYEKSKYKVFFCSNECRGKYFSQEKNPNYGNRQIKLNIRKGKYVKCYNCGNLIYVKPCKVKEIEMGKKVFCCWDCKIKYERGENASSWKGGLSFIIYPKEFNYYLKNKIRKRDNYQCQLCSLTQEEHKKLYKVALCIHHIDYDKTNNKENNLITLCSKCHQKTNKDRIFWKNILSIFLEAKYGDKFPYWVGQLHRQSGYTNVPSEGNLRVQSGYMRGSLFPKRDVESSSSSLLATKNLSGADNPQGSLSLMRVDPSETKRRHSLSFMGKSDDIVRAAQRCAETGRNDLSPLL